MQTDRVVPSPRLLDGIESARKRLGLTQAQLGDAIGKSVGYFSALMSHGVRSMSRNDLLAVMDLLEIDPTEYGIERAPSGVEWTLPDEFNLVPLRDRHEAEKVLRWMFRLRDSVADAARD